MPTAKNIAPQYRGAHSILNRLAAWLLIIVLSFTVTSTHAKNYTWNNAAGGSFQTTTNWSPVCQSIPAGTAIVSNSTTVITIGGDVEFVPTSSLEIEIGGTDKGAQYDALTIGGAAFLDGDLEVLLINGFPPQLGNTFEFLTAADGVNGQFDEFLPPLGGGLFFDVVYQPNAVVLTVAGNPGDYNYDGAINAADYIVWRKTFAQTGPALLADGNNNGTIDSGDHDLWQTNFGEPASAGGPGNANATVPEPNAIVLIALSLVLPLFPRMRISATR